VLDLLENGKSIQRQFPPRGAAQGNCAKKSVQILAISRPHDYYLDELRFKLATLLAWSKLFPWIPTSVGVSDDCCMTERRWCLFLITVILSHTITAIDINLPTVSCVKVYKPR